MLLRVAIQNAAILACAVLFAASAVAAAALPSQAAILALAYVAASGAAAAQWCHEGVRQCALKRHLLALERSLGRAPGWEATLPAMRPRSPLGSRWFLSTKGAIIALQATSLGLAGALDLEAWGPALALAAAGAVATALLLLLNPKE